MKNSPQKLFDILALSLYNNNYNYTKSATKKLSPDVQYVLQR